MTRKTRRLIFFGMVLVFLIVTPGVILFASGFVFDWQNWQIVKTGALYIKTYQAGAQISVNNEQIYTSPSFISRLMPGRYLVSVTKDGYTPWQKKLDVKEQIATEARNILLVPKNLSVLWVADNVTSSEEYFLTEQQKNANTQADLTASTTLKDILVFSVFQNNIYYLQKSNFILYKTDLSGSSKEQISLQPLPPPTKAYQIVISPEQIAVYEPDGKFFLFDAETKVFNLIADEIRGVKFSSDNEKTLFWTDHEIWVVWLKDVWVQPYRKTGDKELITRYGNKIMQAAWLDKTNEHIIFTVRDGDSHDTIKLTELDGRDQRNTFDIYSVQNPEIYWNIKDDLLYILTQRQLYSLDLMQT